MPEKTAEAFTADSWVQTGDVGKVDENGYFTIVGRSKDLIISGGYNVYPAEIESYANESPGVAESAVIGVPHPDFRKGVVAAVVPKSGAALDPESIAATLKSRIAGFKVQTSPAQRWRRHQAELHSLSRKTAGATPS
jgi:malonyl-CoA/methylmalonyl-CoA synthetase